MKTKDIPYFSLTLLCGLLALARSAQAGSAFTYQGSLQSTNGPATGLFDMRFSLFNALNGGANLGVVSTNRVPVTNGLFTVLPDFGPTAFSNGDRWLEIAVLPAGAGTFITLSPRTLVTPTPLALHAYRADSVPNGSVTAAQLAAAPAAPGQVLAYNGSSLVWQNSPAVSAWSRTGTSAAGGDFLGTVNNQPLELKVNNARALRLEPNPTSPNVVAGHGANSVSSGVYGAAIGGGGSAAAFNLVTGNFGTVGGGEANVARGGGATIAGGTQNETTGFGLDTVGGGYRNHAGGDASTISGGYENQTILWAATVSGGTHNVASGLEAVVGGGGNNTAGGTHSTISGGVRNSSGFEATVGGGSDNRANGVRCTVSGGGNNEAQSYDSTVGGGYGNLASGFQSTVPGGSGNLAGGDFSFAAGHRAKALHTGSFVWGDATEADVASTAANQFLVRASGGMKVEGHLTTSVLKITGGADVAEPFQMSCHDIPEGAVVVIDEENPGKLKMSGRAYDSRVAGIISGAKGINPGIMLQQEGVLEGGRNVALSGRVYVQADASRHPIKPGDLLTTSDVPGHAMKAADSAKTSGAVLGKAMTGLDEGRGMVLVLVSLQ